MCWIFKGLSSRTTYNRRTLSVFPPEGIHLASTRRNLKRDGRLFTPGAPINIRFAHRSNPRPMRGHRHEPSGLKAHQ